MKGLKLPIIFNIVHVFVLQVYLNQLQPQNIMLPIILPKYQVIFKLKCFSKTSIFYPVLHALFHAHRATLTVACWPVKINKSQLITEILDLQPMKNIRHVALFNFYTLSFMAELPKQIKIYLRASLY